MTAWCDWIAVASFLIAVILSLTPAAPPHWNWQTFTAIGLLAWAVPIALAASRIAHS